MAAPDDLLLPRDAAAARDVDLHASQIQGFFDIPVDHLYAAPIVVEYFRANPIENLIVVAPDTGGAERARAYAKRLHAGLALCDKRRERANEADVMNIVGDVKGKNCLIIDDMISTGGTIAGEQKKPGEAGSFAAAGRRTAMASGLVGSAESNHPDSVQTSSVMRVKQQSCLLKKPEPSGTSTLQRIIRH